MASEIEHKRILIQKDVIMTIRKLFPRTKPLQISMSSKLTSPKIGLTGTELALLVTKLCDCYGVLLRIETKNKDQFITVEGISEYIFQMKNYEHEIERE